MAGRCWIHGSFKGPQKQRDLKCLMDGIIVPFEGEVAESMTGGFGPAVALASHHSTTAMNPRESEAPAEPHYKIKFFPSRFYFRSFGSFGFSPVDVGFSKILVHPVYEYL